MNPGLAGARVCVASPNHETQLFFFSCSTLCQGPAHPWSSCFKLSGGPALAGGSQREGRRGAGGENGGGKKRGLEKREVHAAA